MSRTGIFSRWCVHDQCGHVQTQEIHAWQSKLQVHHRPPTCMHPGHGKQTEEPCFKHKNILSLSINHKKIEKYLGVPSGRHRLQENVCSSFPTVQRKEDLQMFFHKKKYRNFEWIRNTYLVFRQPSAYVSMFSSSVNFTASLPILFSRDACIFLSLLSSEPVVNVSLRRRNNCRLWCCKVNNGLILRPLELEKVIRICVGRK